MYHISPHVEHSKNSPVQHFYLDHILPVLTARR
jgi:hypothetical protein